MTPKQSGIRLALYIALAMVMTALAGLQVIDFKDEKVVVGWILSIIATGLTTARAYIDQTPSRVETKPVSDDSKP